MAVAKWVGTIQAPHDGPIVHDSQLVQPACIAGVGLRA